MSSEEIKQIFTKRLFLSFLLEEKTKVDLTLAFIQEANSDFLFDTLSFNSKVKELVLKENSFGLMGKSFLAATLSINSSFTSLNLSRNQITSDHLDKKRIGSFNVTITNLKYLNISENTLRGSEGDKAIGRILEYLPNLHHLNLNKNKLEKGGVYLFL